MKDFCQKGSGNGCPPCIESADLYSGELYHTGSPLAANNARQYTKDKWAHVCNREMLGQELVAAIQRAVYVPKHFPA